MDSDVGSTFGKIAPAVHTVYGSEDLSSVPAFSGGFINFGYWEGIPLDRALTADDRTRSEQNLYRRVLGELGDRRGAAVEIGCGLGLGCAMALKEFDFKSVTGVDVHPDQLDRARQANADLLAKTPPQLSFVSGAAERMPFSEEQFDCLYTVEAAQHFRDLPAFARECMRVLRPGGRVAVSSFFIPEGDDNAAALLAKRLESFATGLDVAHRLGALTDALVNAGLTDVRCESIGEHVWAGFDRFLAGIEQPAKWPRNFLGTYHDGLLDYYVVTAERPAGE